MKLPGVKTLRQAGRWLGSRLTDHALILGYHRVAYLTEDPFQLAVSPDHFAEHLAVIRRLGRPLRLSDLPAALKKRRSLRGSVILTFDDGYVDLLATVKPLLERFDMPATLFVITGLLGQAPWWDELVHVIFSPTALPPAGCLQGDTWSLEWPPAGVDRREALLWGFYDQLRFMPVEPRKEALQALGTWSGARPFSVRAAQIMSPAELTELAAGELIDIGAHSVSHPFLATLPAGEQAAEIGQSRQALQEMLARPIDGFSYPNGSYSPLTENFVREAGFKYACSSGNDVVRPGSRPTAWPRFWVPDWDGDTFARWLNRWL